MNAVSGFGKAGLFQNGKNLAEMHRLRGATT